MFSTSAVHSTHGLFLCTPNPPFLQGRGLPLRHWDSDGNCQSQCRWPREDQSPSVGLDLWTLEREIHSVLFESQILRMWASGWYWPWVWRGPAWKWNREKEGGQRWTSPRQHPLGLGIPLGPTADFKVLRFLLQPQWINANEAFLLQGTKQFILELNITD